MKIFLPLAIFALYVTISHSAITNQSSVINVSQLNSSISTVFKGTNSTDYGWTTVDSRSVIFGAGSTSTTSYVYGFVFNTRDLQRSFISKIYKRTLNNKAIALGTQTVEAAMKGTDTVITPSGNRIPAFGYQVATGLGCAAIFSIGLDGNYWQMYVNIVSGNSAIQTQIGDPVQNNVFLGNVWYDWGSDAFFYTYVIRGYDANISSSVYVGGIYANGKPYWSSSLAIVSNKTGAFGQIMGGADASHIYVTYLDIGLQPYKLYYSKTVKSPTTTSAGKPSLVFAGTSPLGAGPPIGVWAAGSTYGISFCSDSPSSLNNYSCLIAHYLNGSYYLNVSVNTGISCPPNGSLAVVGWRLDPGYTLIYKCTLFGYRTNYTMETYDDDGIFNSSITLGSILGGVSFYQDVNGATWVGWTDYKDFNNETSTSYNGYLAKLQGPSPTSDLTWVWILLGIVGVMLVIATIFWVVRNKKKQEEALYFRDEQEPSERLT